MTTPSTIAAMPEMPVTAAPPSGLNRPVWSALSTRHAGFAVGGERARRFVPDIGPLAAARDDAPDSLSELAALVPAGEPLYLLQSDDVVVPPGIVAVSIVPGVQLVAERPITALASAGIERLTDADFPAMLALATLTKPGPFAARTARLGEFWGIKDGGVLVAMAGERLKQDGFTEVSGVCTHPDARGRGLARVLSAFVASRIAARGETAYLHAYASNVVAIDLYRSLGFAVCRHMHVATLMRG